MITKTGETHTDHPRPQLRPVRDSRDSTIDESKVKRSEDVQYSCFNVFLMWELCRYYSVRVTFP